MNVDPGLIPSLETVNREGMSQVIRPRANAPCSRLHAAAAKEPPDAHRNPLGSQRLTVPLPEKWIGCKHRAIAATKVAAELGLERWMKRHPPAAALALGHKKHTALQVHITDSQTCRFVQTEARAV